jgi:hypothetical protein
MANSTLPKQMNDASGQSTAFNDSAWGDVLVLPWLKLMFFEKMRLPWE